MFGRNELIIAKLDQNQFLQMNQYFPSARSKVLGLFLWGLILVPFALALYDLSQLEITSELIIRILILTSILIFVGVIWFGTGYFITDRQLIVRIGPIVHSRVDLMKISEISKTNSWISAPANSLNRLAIRSDKSLLVMVSPKDQGGFIESLKKRNPDINVNLE